MNQLGSEGAANGACVALGVFDGVHLGHQALARRCAAEAATRDLMPIAYSFEPHPAAFFRGATEGSLLTLPERRAELLRAHGIARTVFASFDTDFAQQTPEQFMDRLRHELGARVLVTGPDYRFGKARAGDVSTLGADDRFEVIVLEEVGATGHRVRSSAMREALQAGDAEHLKRLTGRFFDLEGAVVRGQGRGRSLGFPTANLALDARQMTPGDGVYAVRVVTPSGLVDGVMNVGRAPTLRGDEGARVLEVHLIDHQAELYGERLRVELRTRLRGERRFEGVEALAAQIARDVEAARQALL